ncbi:unnamed protein product [Heligmosomoides polygyrus]|uniref:Uncharacterized protein n=1 Tax=Heligmosomoides polygyrus TaxID=6339 RepID=A0A183GDR7_HELPZ|nr:unnamed protein product [Heligmosomoides polygyrus]
MICLFVLLLTLALFAAYLIYLLYVHHYQSSQDYRLFTVGTKPFYNWDLTVLIPKPHPQLIYRATTEPPEYAEVACASPLPSYDVVVYNDQLARSFQLLTSVK